MGMLVKGVWQDVWYDTRATGGAFVRQDAAFRNRVSPEPDARFRPEAGRYHLYVSLACPWAHRTLILRALKGLEQTIPVSVVDPLMLEHGWEFSGGPGCAPDPLHGDRYLYQVYQRACADYTGRVTVPVLWDRQEETIVNNESSEILRMLNSAFDGLATRSYPDLYPEDLRSAIDAINERIYHAVNNGVYKAGFATTQDVYENAVIALFSTLDSLEATLGQQAFLAGDRVTEADWRLFTTLIRFDAVYHGHFKCNIRRIVDYPNLWEYTRALYQVPGVAETVSLDHIKRHYYGSHRTINPTGIVPVGPALDLLALPSRRAP